MFNKLKNKSIVFIFGIAFILIFNINSTIYAKYVFNYVINAAEVEIIV